MIGSDEQQQQQQQQKQQGRTISLSSMEGARSNSPQEVHSQTAGKTSMSTTSVVTPSSLSLDNVYRSDEFDGSKKSYNDYIAHMDDDNGAWRKHGQLVRANIVLIDEENEDNSFALSDSFTIERYYHVADVVLEQFLLSDISDRSKLIESYLIGNRLFKFLSVVLPTHNQYFSLEPMLTSLRHRNEVQLIELLEFMDEVELMIDEMEYNRYILHDLTPSGLKFNNVDENSPSITSLDDRDTVGKSKYDERNDISSGKSRSSKTSTWTSIATPETPIQWNYEESLQPTEEEEDDEDEDPRQMTSSSSSSNQMFQGVNVTVAVQAIEDLHQIQGSHATTNICESQRKILKERAAAVMTTSNNLKSCNDSLEPIPSAFNNVPRSTESPTYITNMQYLHRYMDTSNTMMTQEIETHTHNDTNGSNNQAGLPIKPTKHLRHSQRKTDEQEGNSFNSWDADFSLFDAFSEGSHIDLLLQDHCPPEPKSPERIKPLPTIKEPPISHPRSVWAQTHARLLSPIEWTEITKKTPSSEQFRALSDCSTDTFQSLEDLELSPITTEIEECTEEAALIPRQKMSSTTVTECARCRKFRGCLGCF